MAIERNIAAGNTVAHALESWSLDQVALLIDHVSEGYEAGDPAFRSLLRKAELDCQMMPRLTRLARAIVCKIAAGQMTRNEARTLNGTLGSDYDDND